MDFDFLNDISLEEVKTVKKTRTTVSHQPENADFRLLKNGKIYPSDATIVDYDLEYSEKDAENPGNGFDIIDTKDFPGYPESAPRIVMIALVPKSEKKVDLFGQVGYNEDGTPKKSVSEQGSSTFGKHFIDLLEEVYDVELFPEGVNYVDLNIDTEHALTTPNDIYLMPKTISKGDNKGQLTFERRTNTRLHPLTIATEIEETEETTEQTEATL